MVYGIVRRLAVLFILFLFVGLFSFSVYAGENVIVKMHDTSYSPNILTIPAGTTVTWVFKSAEPHTVTADDDSFDSDVMLPGKSFSHTFARSGEYPYHCLLHLPEMVGKIIVK